MIIYGILKICTWQDGCNGIDSEEELLQNHFYLTKENAYKNLPKDKLQSFNSTKYKVIPIQVNE